MSVPPLDEVQALPWPAHRSCGGRGLRRRHSHTRSRVSCSRHTPKPEGIPAGAPAFRAAQNQTWPWSPVATSIAERMRMRPIDQSLMELLGRSSPAPAHDVAQRILGEDVSQIETYSERVKRMVGKVLTEAATS